MSTKYNIWGDIPSGVLCKRLEELSDAITKKEVPCEFFTSAPAQCDRDADLILSAASKRIKDLLKQLGAVPETTPRVRAQVPVPKCFGQRYDDVPGVLCSSCDLSFKCRTTTNKRSL